MISADKFGAPKSGSALANSTPELYPPDYDRLHRADYRPDGRIQPLTLSPADYERFRAFVLERIGWDFPDGKQQTLARSLAEVLATTTCTTLDQFYELLRVTPSSSPLWDRLVAALTVGETYFFRNTPHFDALANEVLPTLLTQREHLSRRIRIWSAGCATGEEPYSIAILLRELIPALESWNVLILATDINRDALRRAREGVYGPWSFRGVAKRIQDAYFRLNPNRQFVLADEIKRMVTFDYLNLAQDPYPALANNTNAMDIILCRNVTIYFTPQVTQRVLASFNNCLTDGGWLVPGAAEPNMVFYNEFDVQNFPGAVLYRKPATPRLAKPSPWFVPANPSPPPAAPPLPPSKPIPPPTPKPLPAPPRRDPYQVAVELMHQGHTEQALAKLYEKLDEDASFVPTYYTLGKIFANKGNLEEAQHWCERAIKRDKLHPEPYYTLSLIYQQHGLNDMAIDALKKAIYLDRNFMLAHYNLAQIYIHQNEPALARKSLQNIRQLLEGKPRDMAVPEGDGLVIGRLLELVDNQLAEDK